MFNCPVVERDERFVTCAFKRHKHWRGEDFASHDCKAAMNGSKCPVIHMLKKEYDAGEALFFDAETRLHKLSPDIIARIDKLILVPGQLDNLNLTDEQRTKLLANTPIPGGTPAPERSKTVVKRKRKAADDSQVDLTDGLGEITTDMASLVNSALEGSVSND